MKRILFASLFSLFMLMPAAGRAATTPPDVLVKNVTEHVLTILRQDKGIRAGDHRRAVALIETEVAPHFDFTRMTRLAVGRAWQQAKPAQQQALVSEFRSLLVNTYANALASYRNQTVNFRPTAPAAAATGEVTVRSQIAQPGAQPIDIDYSLAKSGDGWKVFDVAIAKVSLVTNYRGSFAQAVTKGGIDALLDELRAKNRHLETTAAAAA